MQKPLQSIVLAFVWAGVLTGVYQLSALFGKGLEFTDNAFYWLWAAQPQHVIASPHPFGFLTHWVWVLAGKSSTHFEFVGLAGLLLVAGLFAITSARFLGVKGFERVWLLALIMVSALFYYQFALFLPSYNWLSLLAVLLFFSALLELHHGEVSSKAFWSAMLLLSSAGLMAFYARPATFASLMGVLVVVLFFKRNHSLTYALSAVGVTVGGFALSSWLIWGGVRPFLEHLRHGVQFANALYERGAYFDILRSSVLQAYQLVEWSFVEGWLSYWFFFVCLYGLLQYRCTNFNARIWRSWATAALLLHLFAQVWGQKYYAYPFFEFYLSLFLLLSVDAALARLKGETPEVNFSTWFFLLLLGAAVFMPSLSTLNHLARHASMSVVLLVAPSAWMLLVIENKGRVLLKSVFSLAVLVAVGANTIRLEQEHYRLPEGFDHQKVPIVLLDGDARAVDVPTARYIESLKSAALSAGWQSGIGLVDLTGATPGALWVLNAKVLGTPWLIGGRKGSEAHAAAYLSLIHATELAQAWVLTAPEGRRALHPRVFTGDDRGLSSTHEVVAELYFPVRNEKQILWRPKPTI